MIRSRPLPGPQAVLVTQPCSDVALPDAVQYNVTEQNSLGFCWLSHKPEDLSIEVSVTDCSLKPWQPMCVLAGTIYQELAFTVDTMFGLINAAGVKRMGVTSGLTYSASVVLGVCNAAWAAEVNLSCVFSEKLLEASFKLTAAFLPRENFSDRCCPDSSRGYG